MSYWCIICRVPNSLPRRSLSPAKETPTLDPITSAFILVPGNSLLWSLQGCPGAPLSPQYCLSGWQRAEAARKTFQPASQHLFIGLGGRQPPSREEGPGGGSRSEQGQQRGQWPWRGNWRRRLFGVSGFQQKAADCPGGNEECLIRWLFMKMQTGKHTRGWQHPRTRSRGEGKVTGMAGGSCVERAARQELGPSVDVAATPQ